MQRKNQLKSIWKKYTISIMAKKIAKKNGTKSSCKNDKRPAKNDCADMVDELRSLNDSLADWDPSKNDPDDFLITEFIGP